MNIHVQYWISLAQFFLCVQNSWCKEPNSLAKFLQRLNRIAYYYDYYIMKCMGVVERQQEKNAISYCQNIAMYIVV